MVTSSPLDIRAIYSTYQVISNKYPKIFFEQTGLGQKMSVIDHEIRLEAKNQGIVLKIQAVGTPGFVEILENMTPEVSQKLCQQIFTLNSKNLKTALQNPYPKDTEGFKQYQAFMQCNSCKILGVGNSKVIEIVPQNGGAPYIIKLNNNLGLPKLAARHFEDKMTGSCVKTYTSIPTILDSGKAYDLMVMDAAGTDLDTFFTDKKFSTQFQRREAALPVFKKMVEILIQMQDKNLFFPDSKSSNWQLKDGQLFIADTKSLKFIQNHGVNFNKSLVFTSNVSPPEFSQTSTTSFETKESVEKAHVFIMAMNMANVLTGKKIKCNPMCGDFGNINDTLTKIEDKVIRDFLYKCLNPNPDERPSLLQAQELINKLDEPYKNPQNEKILNLISELEKKSGGLFTSSGAQKAVKVREAYDKMSAEDRLSTDEKVWKPVLDALASHRGIAIFEANSFQKFKQTLNETKAAAKQKEAKSEQADERKPVSGPSKT